MMKKHLLLFGIFCCIVIITTTGCSMEDLRFEYTTGTGLNITKEKYDRNENGDSYSTVMSILGGSCENYYSSEGEDWYTCVDNKDSSKRIVLKFINDQLKSKSSSGLN